MPHLDNTAQALLVFGSLLLLGLLATRIGHRTSVPRVTLLLIMGIAVGPSAFDVLPDERETWFPIVTDLALVMIGFLLGAEFEWKRVKRSSQHLACITTAQAVSTSLVVGVALWIVGVELEIVLVLAGISIATAPAATVDVVRQYRARGHFTTMLLRIVAFDDVLAVAMFSVLLAAAGLVAEVGSNGEVIVSAAWEIGGAVLLGTGMGLAFVFLVQRASPMFPIREEAVTAVLLVAGVALWLEISPLMTAVVMGVMVANFNSDHRRTFSEIEYFREPVLMIFFLLAGASLEIGSISTLGLVGGVYIVMRSVGKIGGAYVGAELAGAPDQMKRWLGFGLLPQAGVALALALAAVDRLPEHADTILAVTIASTVVFELVGPILVRVALEKAGETDAAR